MAKQMPEGPIRVCGNCFHSDLFKSAETINRDFKCSIGMKWTTFDKCCNSHVFVNEPVVEIAIPAAIITMSENNVKET